MTNFFDQFDAPAQTSKQGANFFDQFDHPQGMPASSAAPFPGANAAAPVGQFLATAGAHALGGLVGSVGQNLAPGMAPPPETGIFDKGMGNAFTAKEGAPSPLRARMDQLLSKGGMPSPTPQQAAATPDAPTVSKAALNTMGVPEYKPETLAGRVGMGAATGAILGALDPATLPAQVLGAAGGEAAGQLAPANNRAAQFWARLGGSIPGIAAGGITSSALRPPGQSVNQLTGVLPKGSIDPETAQLAQAGMEAGVPVNVAQLSNNPFIRRSYTWTKNLPLSGAAAGERTQKEGFAGWLGGMVGEPNATKLTPELFANARDKVGTGLDQIGARTGSRIGPDQLQKLADIESSAIASVTEGEWKPIQMQLSNVISKVGPGDLIPGNDYQALTRFGTPLGTAMRSPNPNIRYFAGQIRSVLDEGLQAASSPEDAIALQQLRGQWKNILTWEPLTMKADTLGGATPSTGEISPAAALAQVRQTYGPFPSKYGQAGKEALTAARFGQRFLKEPSTSGSAENMGISQMLGHGGGLGAAALGAHEAGASLPWLAATIPAYLTAGAGINALLRNQMLARQQVRSALNPGSFGFSGWPPAALPFALAPRASEGTPLQ